MLSKIFNRSPSPSIIHPDSSPPPPSINWQAEWDGIVQRLAVLDGERLLTQAQIAECSARLRTIIAQSPKTQQEFSYAFSLLFGQYVFTLRSSGQGQGQGLQQAVDWGRSIGMQEGHIKSLIEMVDGHIARQNALAKSSDTSSSAPLSSSVSSPASSPQPLRVSENISPLEKLTIGFIEQGIQCAGISADTSGIRHSCYRFKKSPAVGFDKLEGVKAEVLSTAGFDPELEVIFRRLPDNEFEMHIPLPVGDRKVVHLLRVLIELGTELEKKRGEDLLRSGESDAAKQLVHHLRTVIPRMAAEVLKTFPSSSGLILPFGIELSGSLFWLDLTANVLLVGQPNSGKSVGIKNIGTGFSLMHGSSQGQMALFDFKDGLTLNLFSRLPHVWTPEHSRVSKSLAPAERELADTVDELMQDLWESGCDLAALSPSSSFGFAFQSSSLYPSNVMTSYLDKEVIMSWMNGLSEEFTRRVKVIRQSGLENIYQYNSLGLDGGEVIPPLPIFMEELTRFNKVMGGDGVSWLWDALSQWRCAGMPIIGSVQFAKSATGLPPEIRSCFGTGVCFKTSKLGASFIFDDDEFMCKSASRLSGSGDALVKQHGKYSHIQTLNVETHHLKSMVDAICG